MRRCTLWLTVLIFAVGLERTVLAEGVRCEPACAPGFVCNQGTCVSACNPPCGDGMQCTANATCEPIPAPVPIQEQTGPFVVGPAPPPAQAPTPVPVASGPSWSGTTEASQVADDRDRGAHKTRLALGMMLGVGGTIGLSGYGENDAAVTPGFVLVLDRALGSHFAFGGATRFYAYQGQGAPDRFKALDIVLQPRIRFSAGILDFYFAPLVGLALAWAPGGGDVNPGLGPTISLVGGLQFYLGRSFALFVEGGVLSRFALFGGLFDDGNVRLVQGVLNFGVALVL